MLELYANIKKYRKIAQLSQEELAKKVGYNDRSSIAKIENGDVDLPQSKIIAIARALHVDAGTLMGWEDRPEGTVTPGSSVSSASIPEGSLIVSDPLEIELVEAYRKKDLSGRNMIRGALGLPMLGESSTSGSAGPADLRGEENIA